MPTASQEMTAVISNDLCPLRDACPIGWDHLKRDGYVIMQNFLTERDRHVLIDYAHSIPSTKRMLCGASFVQPESCHLNIVDLQSMTPHLVKHVHSTLAKIEEEPLYEFGDGIYAKSAEFITIRKWNYTPPAKCVFASLFSAATRHLPDLTMDCDCFPYRTTIEDRSLERCWLKCMYHTITKRMFQNETKAILTNAVSLQSDTCSDPVPSFLDDHDFDHVLGHDVLWSSIRSWSTKVSGLSLYNGYHDWHVDGQSLDESGAEDGRFHKLFIMLLRGPPENSLHTNLRIAPNRYKHGFDTSGVPLWKNEHNVNNSDMQLYERIHSSRRRVWGLRDDWQQIENVGCNAIMGIGDATLTREDVWHRTQDIKQDRLLLKIDIWRPSLNADRLESRKYGHRRFSV